MNTLEFLVRKIVMYWIIQNNLHPEVGHSLLTDLQWLVDKYQGT